MPVPSTMKPEALGRMLVGEAYLAAKLPADAGDDHFHLHLVLVFADLVELIGSGHALRQDAGILEQLIGAISGCGNGVRTADLQAVLESAMASARMA